MTAQLGDGSAIAAVTGINVVTDLRALDVALGGQGAPLVPIGEKILLGNYNFFLNLGGIANLSANMNGPASTALIAFDVCPANRVLNLLANEVGKAYDENGELAASGTVNEGLLQQLNVLEYYSKPYPKSLSNDFGTDVVYPLIRKAGCSLPDALRTMVEHIITQISKAIQNIIGNGPQPSGNSKLLATGGGAFNNFLVDQLGQMLKPLNVEIVIPEENLVKYKEALIMALVGVLRWREENNVLASVTGAARDSIGGAVWIGQEA